ncbi:unnamed protein product [Pseudo-nitzschia multistriata]|uniref:Uncharacterized protein n=1 Tax=Pseudo-nitzschia multistriata TaxID=183589 RepID=A0A448ZML6_9STRA|nr:unnamed protein product [Pseudo-nitzschia multistriata]
MNKYTTINMDLLAGYGSSDSEDGPSPASGNRDGETGEPGPQKEQPKPKPKPAGLALLLGGGADDGSCSSSSEGAAHRGQAGRGGSPAEPASKKPRRGGNEGNHDTNGGGSSSRLFLARHRLPFPRLASLRSGSTSPSSSSSMVHRSRDSLSREAPRHREKGSPETITASIGSKQHHQRFRFKQLAALVAPCGGSHKSWAEAIKSEQGFHNPGVFQSVMERSGITEPLGSRADPA